MSKLEISNRIQALELAMTAVKAQRAPGGLMWPSLSVLAKMKKELEDTLKNG